MWVSNVFYTLKNYVIVYGRVAGKLFLKVGPRGKATWKQSTHHGDVWWFSLYAELRTFLWGTGVPNWWDHRLGWIIRTPQHRHMISQRTQRTLARKILQVQPRFKCGSLSLHTSAWKCLKSISGKQGTNHKLHITYIQGTSISSGVISLFSLWKCMG